MSNLPGRRRSATLLKRSTLHIHLGPSPKPPTFCRRLELGFIFFELQYVPESHVEAKGQISTPFKYASLAQQIPLRTFESRKYVRTGKVGDYAVIQPPLRRSVVSPSRRRRPPPHVGVRVFGVQVPRGAVVPLPMHVPPHLVRNVIKEPQ